MYFIIRLETLSRSLLYGLGAVEGLVHIAGAKRPVIMRIELWGFRTTWANHGNVAPSGKAGSEKKTLFYSFSTFVMTFAGAAWRTTHRRRV